MNNFFSLESLTMSAAIFLAICIAALAIIAIHKLIKIPLTPEPSALELNDIQPGHVLRDLSRAAGHDIVVISKYINRDGMGGYLLTSEQDRVWVPRSGMVVVS